MILFGMLHSQSAIFPAVGYWFSIKFGFLLGILLAGAKASTNNS